MCRYNQCRNKLFINNIAKMKKTYPENYKYLYIICNTFFEKTLK